MILSKDLVRAFFVRAAAMKKKKLDQELMKALKELGLVGEDFTGKLVININQSGVTDVEKTEIVKPVIDQGP